MNKGTIQGSVSGPYMYNVFMNDLQSDLYMADPLSSSMRTTPTRLFQCGKIKNVELIWWDNF